MISIAITQPARCANRESIFVATCLIAVGAISGCDERTRPTPRSADANPINSDAPVEERVADLTPIETVHRIRQLRDRGQYSQVEPFLPPRHRSAVTAQFRAVDRLIAAARLLQSRVRENMGIAAAQSFARYAQVGNIIGVFSRDATILDQQVDGGESRVTFQIADRLPLCSARMTREGERWVLHTDPIDGVPEQLLKLALMLERFAQRVAAGEFTHDQLHREIELRQSSIMRRLGKLVSQADADAASNNP